MVQALQKKLSDNKSARWLALFIVSFTMLCGYFFTDVMSPLEKLLTESTSVVYFEDGSNMTLEEINSEFQQGKIQFSEAVNFENADESLKKGMSFDYVSSDNQSQTKTIDTVIKGNAWSAKEYGFFSGAYGLINVFLLMLFFGGIILDKMGIRFTGVLSCSLMIIGAALKWYAVSNTFDFTINLSLLGVNLSGQTALASLGFAIYGVGAEITGVTVTKIIVKWFSGKEMAFAMGFQVSFARLGTAAAFSVSLPIAKSMGAVSYPILFGLIALCIGLIIFLVYCVMDKKEDVSIKELGETSEIASEEDNFKISDIGFILSSPGFWLITLLCLMFYGAVLPFLKFATNLMIFKYGVEDQWAGMIPSLLSYGSIFLTPIFGIIYDKIGKGATLMLIGSVMLTLVHVLFSLPFIDSAVYAVINMIVLGIAFSLVPSAMWPSVPKIIPMRQLGSAYAIIFYIQNIGLSLIPMIMGAVIESNTSIVDGKKIIDYTMPMSIFAAFGVVAILISLGLIAIDKKKNYGLQKANIKND